MLLYYWCDLAKAAHYPHKALSEMFVSLNDARLDLEIIG